MASSQAGKHGEFKANVPPQHQSLPGLEKDMAPTSESTKFEGSDGFVEYKGSGKLSGKTALITGGDSGIGRAVAALYAREGANVSIVYLPDEQPDAEETQRIVEEAGQKCVLIPFNLENLREIKQGVLQKHLDAYGGIDILVNNASRQQQVAKFEDIEIDQIESTFRANILQMMVLAKEAIPHLKKGSSIINTTSTVAFRGTKTLVDYASTKAAIVGFTRSLQKNLMERGIRVNAVAPGPVHTPLQPASRPDEEMEGFGSKSGIGRPGQPSEIATSFVFLASKDATLFYGQVLHAYPLGD